MLEHFCTTSISCNILVGWELKSGIPEIWPGLEDNVWSEAWFFLLKSKWSREKTVSEATNLPPYYPPLDFWPQPSVISDTTQQSCMLPSFSLTPRHGIFICIIFNVHRKGRNLRVPVNIVTADGRPWTRCTSFSFQTRSRPPKSLWYWKVAKYKAIATSKRIHTLILNSCRSISSSPTVGRRTRQILVLLWFCNFRRGVGITTQLSPHQIPSFCTALSFFFTSEDSLEVCLIAPLFSGCLPPLTLPRHAASACNSTLSLPFSPK